MDKKLYELHELLDGTLQAGMVAETVNLGELNYKLWFNPETFILEYKDYPEQVLTIMCAGHEDFDNITTENDETVLFRILS